MFKFWLKFITLNFAPCVNPGVFIPDKVKLKCSDWLELGLQQRKKLISRQFMVDDNTGCALGVAMLAKYGSRKAAFHAMFNQPDHIGFQSVAGALGIPEGLCYTISQKFDSNTWSAKQCVRELRKRGY